MSVGLMLHAHMRKWHFVEQLYHIGLSILYDRVLSLSAERDYKGCERFEQENVICPLRLRSGIFIRRWARVTIEAVECLTN